MRELTVLVRHGCHLCEAMLEELRESELRQHFVLKVVDVDRETELRDRYTERVPVLMMGSQEVCHFFFDPDALQRCIGGS